MLCQSCSWLSYLGIYNGLSMKIMRHSWSAVTTLIILDHLQALPLNMKI